MNQNHMCFNIRFEYAHISSQPANSLFGVKQGEERPGRPFTKMSGLSLFTPTLGLWTPLPIFNKRRGVLVFYFIASESATATATEAPTIGLFPIPMSPIISTWAGTEEEPAN